jgi:hypothetical protein
MKVIITIFFLFSIHLTFGQTFQNGLILPDKNEDEEICCIYSPKDGLKIFDGSNGKVIGKLRSAGFAILRKSNQITYFQNTYK